MSERKGMGSVFVPKAGFGQTRRGNVFIHIFHPVSWEPGKHRSERQRQWERQETHKERIKVEARADRRHQRFFSCFVAHFHSPSSLSVFHSAFSFTFITTYPPLPGLRFKSMLSNEYQVSGMNPFKSI